MSVWHWLGVLLVLAPWGLLAYLAVKRVNAERREGMGITAGLKGWLLVLAVMLWLGVLRSGAEFTKMVGGQDQQVAAQFPGLLVLDAATASVGLCLILAGAWLLSVRSGAFPRVFAAYFAWVVVGPVVSVLLAFAMLHLLYSVPLSLADALSNSLQPEMIGQWIAGVIGIGTWLIYVRRSRRVAVTCVK
jgi:hypothetical protein